MSVKLFCIFVCHETVIRIHYKYSIKFKGIFVCIIFISCLGEILPVKIKPILLKCLLFIYTVFNMRYCVFV